MTPIRMRVEYLLGRYEMFVRDSQRGRSCIEKSLNWQRRFRTGTTFSIITCSLFCMGT